MGHVDDKIAKFLHDRLDKLKSGEPIGTLGWSDEEIGKFLYDHIDKTERADGDLCKNIADMVYLAVKYEEEGGSDIGLDELFTAYAGNMYGFTQLARSKYHIFYVDQLIDTIEKHGLGFLKDVRGAGDATWARVVFGLHSLTGIWYSKEVVEIFGEIGKFCYAMERVHDK